jgi:hypothetical protein
VPDRRRRLWRVYAACSALQVALVLVALLGPLPDLARGALLLVVGVGLLFALGHVQAHVAFNGDLDDAERARWRVAVATVPGAVAFYWHLYVR